MAAIEAKLAKRADRAAGDPAKAAEGARPEPSDVAGQTMSMSTNIYICPECWAMNDVAIDPIRTVFYRCWSCGAFLQI